MGIEPKKSSKKILEKEKRVVIDKKVRHNKTETVVPEIRTSLRGHN